MKINKTVQKGHFNTQSKIGHLNHMDGVSYDIKDPILQLRIVASSCFFGEPMYYSENSSIMLSNDKPNKMQDEDVQNYLNSTLSSTLTYPDYHNLSASSLMELAIDEALNFDIEKTLQEAVRLRNEDNIRTTPQVIMVRAANHKNAKGTGLIRKYASDILKRTDEAAVQLAYQLSIKGRVGIPNSLKKSWKKFLESRSELQLAKYKMEKRIVKTLDVVNLVHAKGDLINKLMRSNLSLDEKTWESYISKNGSSTESWIEAIKLMGHMALLRNIANFIKHKVPTYEYLDKLISTAKNGKQLPFRYFVAYEVAKKEGANGEILDAIETCLNESIGEIRQFNGKTISLCDNSGSAHGTLTSTYGTMTVSKIANLTGVITAKASEDGYVGVFGDKLDILPIRKNNSVFDDVEKMNLSAQSIGQGTENGIWIFFDDAIKNKTHWDNIFIYSDMQAGHGGLYGNRPYEYSNYAWNYNNVYNGNYIDVAKLVQDYRRKVNKNVNVFMVQMAGYKDTLVPEFYDKTYILGGWGDGILKFAHSMIDSQ